MKKERLTVAQKRRMAVERYNRENSDKNGNNDALLNSIYNDEAKSESEGGLRRKDAGNKKSVNRRGTGAVESKKNGNKISKKTKSVICIILAVVLLFGVIATVLVRKFMGKEMFGGYDTDKYGDVVLDARLDGVFTCLLVAADKGGANTDTIMLAVMRDKEKKQIDLISIPRDTRIRNPYGNGYVKINSIFARSGGKLNALVEQVRNLTGIPINEFMFVNIEGIKKTVDMFGGVEFDVPMNMNYEDPYQGLYIHLNKGMQRLDGDKAEQLLRYRYGYANADLGRTQVQRDFMIAAFKQHAKLENLDKLAAWYKEMDGYIQTKLKYEDAYKIASVAFKYADEFKIESRILPGTVIDGYADYFYDAKKINEMAEELGFEGGKVQSTPVPSGSQNSSVVNSTDNLMSEDNEVDFGSDDDFESADEIMPTEAPLDESEIMPTPIPDEDDENNDEDGKPSKTAKPSDENDETSSEKPEKTKNPSKTQKPSVDEPEKTQKPEETKKPSKPQTTPTPGQKPTESESPKKTPSSATKPSEDGYPEGI